MSGLAVRVRGLTRRFGAFTAVDKIDLEVLDGEIFGFLGPNGAGKSTTIRMLCGLLNPSEGTGTVAGYDILTQPDRIKEHIGYMSQRFSLYEDLTVGQNLRFYMGIYGIPRARRPERVAFAMEVAGLTGREEALARELATGWRQRLALACAVLHEPPVLFLDEPTSGVDPISRRRFWDLIHGLAQAGTTVFVTTHYMDEAEYCDRLALIDGGRIVALGSPTELRTHFMEQAVLEVEALPLLESLEALQESSEVLDAAFFGQRLHVRVADPRSGAEAVRGALRARSAEVLSIEQVIPSLEDVFVALVRSKKGIR